MDLRSRTANCSAGAAATPSGTRLGGFPQRRPRSAVLCKRGKACGSAAGPGGVLEAVTIHTRDPADHRRDQTDGPRMRFAVYAGNGEPSPVAAQNVGWRGSRVPGIRVFTVILSIAIYVSRAAVGLPLQLPATVKFLLDARRQANRPRTVRLPVKRSKPADLANWQSDHATGEQRSSWSWHTASRGTADARWLLPEAPLRSRRVRARRRKRRANAGPLIGLAAAMLLVAIVIVVVVVFGSARG